jgi:hypothetical protein
MSVLRSVLMFVSLSFNSSEIAMAEIPEQRFSYATRFVGPIDLKVHTSAFNSEGIWNLSKDSLVSQQEFQLQADTGHVRLETETLLLDGQGDLPGTLLVEYQPELMPAIDRQVPVGEKFFSGRQVFRIRQTLSKTVKVSLEDNPMFHLHYWPQGIPEQLDKETRYFENEIALIPELSVSDKILLFHLPVFFSQVGFTHFKDGGLANERWEFIVNFRPSITFNFARESFLSLVYESRNLIAGDMSALNFDGIREGNVRVFFRWGI